MSKPVDETFLQCCLEELRDGETVTIQGKDARVARKWLAEHGATEEQLSRLQTPGVKARRAKATELEKADENVQRAYRFEMLATVLGYNELTKTALTFGEKVYFRLAMQHAHERLLEIGGQLEITEGEKPVMRIGERPNHINFYPRDIELMRKAVAEHDAKAAPALATGAEFVEAVHAAIPEAFSELDEVLPGAFAPSAALDLGAIEARAADTTPGPWRWWDSNSFRRLSSDATGKDGDVLYGTVQASDGHPDVVCSEGDREFIAQARTDVPALVAEVRRLRTTLERTRDELGHHISCGPCAESCEGCVHCKASEVMAEASRALGEPTGGM